MKFLEKIIIQPKNLVLIFLATALIIGVSVVVELNQSRKEMLQLMQQQSRTLLESLLVSSNNALLSYEKIEEEMKSRLLNNAEMIKTLYSRKMISNSLLESIAKKNNIFRINIFDREGNKIFSNSIEGHPEREDDESPDQLLLPIFDSISDTLIFGIKQSRYSEDYRFAVAISSGDGGAIVLNVDADKLLEFRAQVGFGILLRSLSENPQINYVALQDQEGIIAASGIVEGLESIDSSNFLRKGLEEDKYAWRVAEIDSIEVFEAIHPFYHNNEVIGIFRLGLSLEPLDDINEDTVSRLIILGIVLFVLGSIILALIFVKQNFNLLENKFTAIEKYSKEIIDNVSDAIIVIDPDFNIKSFNNAALQLFNKETQSSRNLYSLFDKEKCSRIINSPSHISEIECSINGAFRLFLLSKSEFFDEKKERNLIFVMRDLTEVKRLESQIKRKERLTEMGKLASSVAHEIRNPLNAIGTITQQLGKDFEPKENEKEFRDLTKLVYGEVRRINETIESFLRFSKPQPVNPSVFNSTELFEQLYRQYSALLNEKNIKLNLYENWKGEVEWDRTQITQAFINLIENAIDAVNVDGQITIGVRENSASSVEIVFADNGSGIPAEDKEKIFHLYFTTKTKGSGIGLSIVQRIIAEHNGLISIESEQGKGTKIIITIPKVFSQVSI